MRIHHFVARKLHGYIDLNLDFRPDLTFLTGINGSGKTSAVRALVAIIGPSLVQLASIQFEELRVALTYNNAFQVVTARRLEDEIVLQHSEVQSSLRMPILKASPFEHSAAFADRQRDFYREQETLLRKDPVLSAIEGLPTPMFLDLDRKNQDGARPRFSAGRFVGRSSSPNPLGGSLQDSLLDAQSLAESTYRDFVGTKNQLTDTLKQDIILTAFHLNEEDIFSGLLVPPPDLKSVEQNEKLVRQSLTDIGVSKERQTDVVDPFYSRLRQVIGDFPTEKQLKSKDFPSDQVSFKKLSDWSGLRPQFRQVESLAALVDAYNQRVRLAHTPIRRYLDVVNRFFLDSGKRVSFDASSNLRITVTSASHSRPIKDLSSGERQLIVILTHLAFSRVAKRANILIIDEPELSLHLRWQELFVSSVLETNPEIQLILATHSPSVIGERIDNCIDVEEKRATERVFF